MRSLRWAPSSRATKRKGCCDFDNGLSISAAPNTGPVCVRKISLTREPDSKVLETVSKPPVSEIVFNVPREPLPSGRRSTAGVISVSCTRGLRQGEFDWTREDMRLPSMKHLPGTAEDYGRMGTSHVTKRTSMTSMGNSFPDYLSRPWTSPAASADCLPTLTRDDRSAVMPSPPVPSLETKPVRDLPLYPAEFRCSERRALLRGA